MAAYFIYLFAAKILIGPVEHQASTNATKVISFENDIGFFWELSIQQWAMDVGEWLPTLFNWVYIVTYWPVILITAAIYYSFRRQQYGYYRRVILLSFIIALIVFATFPLAAPRMMSNHGFIDTITVFGPAWYGGTKMATYYNTYSAMPSLHFAWTLMYAFLFWRTGPLWLKGFAVVYPLSTFLAITITANHYIADAIAGAALMLLAYLTYEICFGGVLTNSPQLRSGLCRILRHLQQKKRVRQG